ncbi:hypothetical protein ZYGR_0I02820 [Zygosaccharomyces rouxii]|uniref:non-specific serine/threonine protein kinase n=1 Tax=Zygosaccharomyces rouxii TaxID=4956 RepID=A0A1Q2ZWS3_ZYGRO|nr:hypothetical protein ZYGR_0I02820 [Zygosaccharomyces rouxii]
MSSRIKRSPHDFVFKEELGNGSYSRVYKAVDRSDPQRVYAVKVCSKRHIIHENKVKYVTIEKNTLNLLARANHPGIVKLHSTFHDEENLYFVLDFAAGGELLSLLNRVGKFTEPCARHFIAQLIDTTEFIHSQGVIHRDLKPENVLLHRDGRLMVTDFGTATNITKENTEGGASFVGTAEYVSPELLLYNQCQFASDVWALGCMLYQFIEGVPPFRGENELHTFEKIVALEYPWANNNKGGVVSLVRRILTLDPSQRPSLTSIKQDKWFEQVDWRNREALWKGIWQVQPQRQQPLEYQYRNNISNPNLPLAKQKRRKPAKVGNTTSSIVEWRKRLGIETHQIDVNRKNVKPSTINNNNSSNSNSTNNNSSNNTTTNGNNKTNKSIRSNSMLKTQAVAHVQEQAELQARMRAPLPKAPGSMVKPSTASKPTATAAIATTTIQPSIHSPLPFPRNRSHPIPKSASSSLPSTTPVAQMNRPPTAPLPLNNTSVQPHPQITRPPTAPSFYPRTPSPVGVARPPIHASMPKTASPVGRASPPVKKVNFTSSETPTPPTSAPAPAPAPAPAQAPTLPPATRAFKGNVSGSAPIAISQPVTTQPLPTQAPSLPSAGKPISTPPKTAPPKLSLDTDQRPTLLTNGSTTVVSTSSKKPSESEILKQDLAHIFEIPYNSSGPDISLQSYKRVDNDLIKNFVADHKSELKPKDQQPGFLTLLKDGTLQYRQRNSSVRHMANIGDTSLSMYDFEFYEKQGRGFLILEKYHHKVWFVSLPKGPNNNNGNSSQFPVIGSDENWVDSIFKVRQLVEDQGLADKLNNVEVSSPRLSSPTIPVTPIYSKARTPSGGSNTSKKYVAPNNMVVSSSRSQVLHALNRNAGVMDASMGASAAFKSLQKK